MNPGYMGTYAMDTQLPSTEELTRIGVNETLADDLHNQKSRDDSHEDVIRRLIDGSEDDR